MPVSPYHGICSPGLRSVNGTVMSSQHSAFQGDNESPSGTDIHKTRKMCSLRRNPWAEISYHQFEKKKRSLRVAAPWETLYAQPLWSVGQTQTRVTLHFKAGNVTLHSNIGLSAKRVSLLGGHCLFKAKGSKDSGSCRWHFPDINVPMNHSGLLQKQIRVQLFWGGPWDSPFLPSCWVMPMLLILDPRFE